MRKFVTLFAALAGTETPGAGNAAAGEVGNALELSLLLLPHAARTSTEDTVAAAAARRILCIFFISFSFFIDFFQG